MPIQTRVPLNFLLLYGPLTQWGGPYGRKGFNGTSGFGFLYPGTRVRHPCEDFAMFPLGRGCLKPSTFRRLLATSRNPWPLVVVVVVVVQLAAFCLWRCYAACCLSLMPPAETLPVLLVLLNT